MFSKHALQTVVSEIADGTPVDWSAIDGTAQNDRERTILWHLKTIVAAAEPQHPAARAVPGERHRFVFRLVLVLAACKAALALLGWYFVLASHSRLTTTAWAHMATLAIFTIPAGALVFGGTRDRRARDLGALFLVTASSVADPLLTGLLGHAYVDTAGVVLRRLPTEAFLAAALWRFAAAFPAPPLGGRDRRLASGGFGIAYAIGVVLFLSNAALLIVPAGGAPGWLHRVLATVDRQSPTSLFWLVSFGVTIPGLPYLLWKSRFGARDERHRTLLFAGALVAGMAPMLLVVVFTPVVPFLSHPANRDLVGVLLYLSLNATVPLTMYAVLVHRVLDLRLAVTRATRLWVVRCIVWVACLAPFPWLAVYMYTRHVSIADILAPPGAALLAPLPLIAVLALTFRHRLIRAFDRRVLGEPTEYAEVFGRLQRDLREVQGVRDITIILAREVDRAIHPHTVLVLVLDDDAQAFVSLAGEGRPLPADSGLVGLLQRARQEVNVGADASGPVGRLLMEDDRRWLIEHGVQLLVPMAHAAGELLGAFAIGGKRTDLPFSKDDRLLLTMMASQGAVMLENSWLRDGRANPRSLRNEGGINWANEPAAICPACRMTWPGSTTLCRCGTATEPAALPLLVSGKFSVQRLIGAGAMSVVYLAVDLALDRKVAIKTLPRIDPDRARRLKREARAMATVAHPNLAMIFGIETWRGTPLLVGEYLEHGTLADRLSRGRLSPIEALDVGIVLADVLDLVHGAGVLHRDIKPTNIGWTRDGAPKLLDFGLARMLDVAIDDPRATRTRCVDDLAAGAGDLAIHESMSTSLTAYDHVVGTPLYLSPEAVAGLEPAADFDLWSLCVVMFEAVAGHNPFAAPTIRQVFRKIHTSPLPDIRTYRPDCPVELAHFFARVLARERLARPRSASELRNRCREVRAELGGDR